MTPIWRFVAAASAAVMLAACQTPAVYGPRENGASTGYSDRQLAQNRWRVTFTGNSATKREAVEDYLLLRSAEVALKSGYHWFEFDNRDTQAETTYQSDYAGWPGWRGRFWHSWGPGPGPEINRPITSYEAYAEIVLLTDDQAKTEPRAIRAEEVLEHLKPAPKP